MSNINQFTSNPDLSSVSDEQLFTELTPEESAVVEGGAFVRIHSLRAIRAGADGFFGGDDDTYIEIGGNRVWGVRRFRTGDWFDVQRGRDFEHVANIEIFDNDRWPNPDDPMGSFTVGNTPTNGVRGRRVHGSGSIYDVYYSVTA
ncbi:MAG: hypothetical protein WA919_16970 [Coleofasciculaceae cyanobacterium]